MFTSQTSSFQDSIDVEEKDTDFDNEEITQQLNCYYSIYFYQNRADVSEDHVSQGHRRTESTTSQEEFSLSLVDTSLPAEAEPELRCYISRRLSKGALLGGMGNIATVDLSLPEQAVGCYCCLLEPDRAQDQAEDEDNGKGLCFVEPFHGCSVTEASVSILQLQNLETEIRPYLSRWYEESVMHVHRVVQLVQGDVAYLLHAALSHTHVEVSGADERTEMDIARFIKAASLQGLATEEATAASLCKSPTKESQVDLLIDCSCSPPALTNAVSNRFCDDWIQAFLNAAERCNPFLLRQILENFKLKAIQDMNNLKRFVRQAEMSHYALFRCCLFLQACGNGDVLLRNARAEHSGLPEACSIIRVLEEFLGEQAQGVRC
ncbi:protein Njmu-R1-like [Scleropages formosus]|uniref:Protein Njmu-R1-like n=1 Tax=Scleropages formosus TaxID=113540 RepID=A0A0N8JYY7_SCLFO|nr:protein Njmu-R1-like [Scleropages formosus]